jgi:hypothetical protein
VHAAPDWRAFLLISAGVLVQMAATGRAGFILAGVALFALTAWLSRLALSRWHESELPREG